MIDTRRLITKMNRVAAVAAVLGIAACAEETVQGGAADATRAQQAQFVGTVVCAECHVDETERWSASHHDLAMQEADAATVLGDFEDASFAAGGRATGFSRRDDGFWVSADGPGGAIADFRVAYTFGVEPLQQYLVATSDGRFQALDVAWDSRPADEGGQRWFHLQPGEVLQADDPLHWTGVAFNWNTMCADCHSTDFRKNYDAERGVFESSFAEIDVACEACHGPGSRHLEWAAAPDVQAERNDAGAAGTDGADEMGLAVRFPSIAEAAWIIDPDSGLARRNPPLTSRAEIATCARCHSRRSSHGVPYEFGGPLTDFYRPALLDEGLYHGDGQILDEVYVYGSFLQSKMYAQGVTCSDCHNPHSLRLNNEGNALCSRCHLAEKFDSTEHHRHDAGTPAASCVACHMPSTTYMVVDPRRDHSFRVPRPDLSATFGVPNACGTCHAAEGARFAADAVEEWFGPQRPEHYSEALVAGGQGLADAALLDLAENFEVPGIVRATVLTRLAGSVDPRVPEVVERALGNGDPLIRLGAVNALQAMDPRAAAPLALRMIRDRDRSVRLEAARVLAFIPNEILPPEERAVARRAIDEYKSAQEANGDRAGAWVNLGAVEASQGDVAAAEQAYRRALAREPYFVPAYINLADLYRQTARNDEGEALLREALQRVPDSADARHALGLQLVRLGRLEEGVESLRQAADSEDAPARYSYVYAVALRDAGDPEGAMDVVRRALTAHPSDRQLLSAAVLFARDAGDLDLALGFARRLVDLDSRDANATRMLQEIELLRRSR